MRRNHNKMKRGWFKTPTRPTIKSAVVSSLAYSAIIGSTSLRLHIVMAPAKLRKVSRGQTHNNHQNSVAQDAFAFYPFLEKASR